MVQHKILMDEKPLQDVTSENVDVSNASQITPADETVTNDDESTQVNTHATDVTDQSQEYPTSHKKLKQLVIKSSKSCDEKLQQKTSKSSESASTQPRSDCTIEHFHIPEYQQTTAIVISAEFYKKNKDTFMYKTMNEILDEYNAYVKKNSSDTNVQNESLQSDVCMAKSSETFQATNNVEGERANSTDGMFSIASYVGEKTQCLDSSLMDAVSKIAEDKLNATLNEGESVDEHLLADPCNMTADELQTEVGKISATSFVSEDMKDKLLDAYKYAFKTSYLKTRKKKPYVLPQSPGADDQNEKFQVFDEDDDDFCTRDQLVSATTSSSLEESTISPIKHLSSRTIYLNESKTAKSSGSYQLNDELLNNEGKGKNICPNYNDKLQNKIDGKSFQTSLEKYNNMNCSNEISADKHDKDSSLKDAVDENQVVLPNPET